MSGIFSREKIAKAASELADHLQLIEHVRSLQTAQKEFADEIGKLAARITDIQVELRALKAETKFECLKETQSIVNAVQGGFNQRLEVLSNKIAVLEASSGSTRPVPRLSSPE